MKRTHAFLMGVALFTGLAVAGCGSSEDGGSPGAQSDEPVKVIDCGTGKGTTMELRATNDYPDPTAYFIQLYWFNGEGRQVEGIRMTSPAVQPGKSATFRVNGRMPGDTSVQTCDVKVLGTQ
ncbi:hypothetical protein ABZX85_09715 [Streptomyces sp. NPDC004539]|uniref:hypothetical protein n=1 Tax=Streptomyces sp. NPDC004539 TaxID=3154280 RepID=UPI0033A17DE9